MIRLPIAALRKRCFLLLVWFNLLSFTLFAQERKYTADNAHSHNDYEHSVPFYTAYNAGFGSIEVDIFLVGTRLYVAHHLKDVDSTRTLESLYLEPLQQAIQKNKGYVYADRSKKLILLVDIKTEALSTLEALLQLLRRNKSVTGCRTLKIVITGNQPNVSELTSYPSYVFFDGHLDSTYTDKTLKRITLFSDNFRNYSDWKGETALPAVEQAKLEEAITLAHKLNRPIRFWAAPDNQNAWKELMRLNADYINTDKIPEIAAFLK